MIEPTKKYDIQFAEDRDGNELRYRFILTVDRPIKTKDMIAKLIQLLDHDLPGIDKGQPLGRYSMEIVIARTFDPDQVLEQLKNRLESDVLSEIVRPKLDLVKP
jgi:hypothetical protein